MDQFSLDGQPQTSSNELVKRLILHENHLRDIKRTLDEMSRKVDSLLAESNRNLTDNGWGLGGSGRPGVYTITASPSILTAITSGRSMEPRKSLSVDTSYGF